jgi:hypothetical protein
MMPRQIAAFSLLIILLAPYVALVWGPLQAAGYDSAEYLEMAAVKADGYAWPRTRLPIGYPCAVIGLERVGIANQVGFATLNLVGFVSGLAAFYGICRASLWFSPFESIVLCAIASLHRTTFEIAAAPQPELLFFGATMLAIYCFSIASPEKLSALIAGLLFSAIAVSLRSIGIALIVPACVAAWKCRTRRLGIATILVCASWAAIAAFLIKWSDYVGGFASRHYRSMGLFETLWFDARCRFDEIADLASNTHFPMHHSLQLTAWMSVLAIVFVAFLLVGLWKQRKTLLTAYFAAYLAILLSWPFPTPRFWVPIALPAMAFVWTGFKVTAARFEGPQLAPRLVCFAWCTWFAAMGLYGYVHGLDWSRAKLMVTQQQSHAWLTTSEIARRDPPDLAFLVDVGMVAKRYGGSAE